MFKFVVVILAIISSAAAKPGLIGAPLTYTAPPAVLTATSSQFISRNHNGIVSTPVVAPIAAPTAYAAPLAYKAPAAYAAPLAYTAPAAYADPLTYASPLHYAYAPAPVLF